MGLHVAAVSSHDVLRAVSIRAVVPRVLTKFPPVLGTELIVMRPSLPGSMDARRTELRRREASVEFMLQADWRVGVGVLHEQAGREEDKKEIGAFDEDFQK